MRICVYGSSSPKTPSTILAAAEECGRKICEGGDVCVNGGGSTGVMGAVNRGARSVADGKIVTVIHEKWTVDGGTAYRDANQMIVCGGNDLQERKRVLLDQSDCLVIMPGGVGTLDEFCEAVCLQQLSFINMPIVLVNVDGFYDHLLKHLEHCRATKLMYQKQEDLVHVFSTVDDALSFCRKAVAETGAKTSFPPLPLAAKREVAALCAGLAAISIVQFAVIVAMSLRRR